jgi:hypothetical protein
MTVSAPNWILRRAAQQSAANSANYRRKSAEARQILRAVVDL